MKQVIILDEDGKMMKSCNEYKSLNTTKKKKSNKLNYMQQSNFVY